MYRGGAEQREQEILANMREGRKGGSGDTSFNIGCRCGCKKSLIKEESQTFQGSFFQVATVLE